MYTFFKIFHLIDNIVKRFNIYFFCLKCAPLKVHFKQVGVE